MVVRSCGRASALRFSIIALAWRCWFGALANWSLGSLRIERVPVQWLPDYADLRNGFSEARTRYGRRTRTAGAAVRTVQSAAHEQPTFGGANHFNRFCVTAYYTEIIHMRIRGGDSAASGSGDG